MLKEVFGMLIGWAVLTIGAWFLSLTIVGYVLGDINPFNWDYFARGMHLALQAVFICLYIAIMQRKAGRRGS